MNTVKQQSFWQSSIGVTIATALVGLVGTGVGVSIQGYHDTKLERQKFESTLILQALEPVDPNARANYLLFLIEAGLVDSLDVEQIKALTDDPARLPSTNPDLKLQSAVDILSSPESVAGEIHIADDNLWTSWRKMTPAYAASRLYKKGRVISFGHDDILKVEGNRDELANTLSWLISPSANLRVGFSSGHCEWIPVKYPDVWADLKKTLTTWKYTVEEIPGDLSSEKLDKFGVLVIGNAWGNFTDAEIEAVRQFVQDGGGLMMAGLGWSWEAYADKENYRCAGKADGQNTSDMSTYPMNNMAAMFGAAWTAEVILK